ncbi:MAG: hypothetical protein O9283_11190 [Sphingomonadaceae bacterium]|nr:hypothetical protein [Novosphingobium sp.]MCZ8325816.1 hypothetical protein [Sphingomonadaceae bacterium]
MKVRPFLFLSAILSTIYWTSPAAADTGAATVRDCRTAGASMADNPRMAAIFEADQADRRETADTDWQAVNRRDLERLSETEALIAANALVTGQDFLRAAFVFQHGKEPRSYLKAHSIALVAMACGNRDAVWIATAALDRYLQAIGQPQVFGTQFRFPDQAPVTQEPYDRSLIPDTLRRQLGVPPLADQERQRLRMQAEVEQGQ